MDIQSHPPPPSPPTLCCSHRHCLFDGGGVALVHRMGLGVSFRFGLRDGDGLLVFRDSRGDSDAGGERATVEDAGDGDTACDGCRMGNRGGSDDMND